jgi:hypothetical protein
MALSHALAPLGRRMEAAALVALGPSHGGDAMTATSPATIPAAPLVTVPLAAALITEQVSLWFLVGGAIALAGVYVGAFLNIRPRRSSATSAPECLPIDACAGSEADTELATRTAS